MSEQNHNRMREWMDRESKVDDQYARDTYFLVNWKELSILQFWYDKTQKPHSVWIRRAWFTPKSTNVSYSQVSDYEEIKKEDAEERWNYSVKEAGFVRWTPYAPECHENDSTVKFHRIVKNEDDVYQTLWSDHGELHYFTVSASTLMGQVNETMCFRSDENGRFTGADECGVVYPASRELDVHGKLAKDAWNALQMDMATA